MKKKKHVNKITPDEDSRDPSKYRINFPIIIKKKANILTKSIT